MGLDTTTTHVVWFIAIVAAAGSIAHALTVTAETLDEARARRDALAEERILTKLSGATFCYDAAAQSLNATARNEGAVLDASDVTLVADGEVLANDDMHVWGKPGRLVWGPGENATWESSPISPSPSRVMIFAGNGAAALAEGRTCPVLTTIVVTPSSASLQLGGAQDYAAQGYDQFGQAVGGFAFSWSTTATGATITSTSDTTAHLVVGTTSGSFTVTASHDGVSGSSTLTVHPGAPTSIQVAPDPATV